MGSLECVSVIITPLNSIISMSGSLRRVIISTKKAPDAIGPYNQAVQVNNTLYISGQIGFNPSTMDIVSGGVVAEAKQALTNMGHILEAANCNFNNVVKTTVLLADINDFALLMKSTPSSSQKTSLLGQLIRLLYCLEVPWLRLRLWLLLVIFRLYSRLDSKYYKYRNYVIVK